MSSLVPYGWSEDYISEYFDFSIGGTPSRNNELYWDANQTTSNIWVSIRDLKDKFISDSAERISDLGVSKSNVKLLPKNTVLMSFKLSIGRLAISMTPLYTNEAIVGFIEKRPNTVDRDYLYYGLQSWNLLGEVDQAVKGATLNKDKMSRIIGIFPPLPEQKKIASILTSVDEVIENTQKQIDKLQDLKKATMNELLTKGIGHTEFKDSELGRIPKSWEVKSLSEVTLKIGDGIHSTPKYSHDGSFPFINGNNLVDGIIKLGKSTKFVDENEFNKQRTRLGDDTILMSINGTIGNLAVYRGEDVVLGKSSAYLTFINDFELTFAYYLLSSDRVQGYFVDELTGTTIRNLSLKTIRNTPIAVPPISEQNAISNVISSIDSSSNSIQQKLSQTQSLKKSLMQDLLTGKVRVTVN